MDGVDDHQGVRVVEGRCRLDAGALDELSQRLDGYRRSVRLGSGWEQGAPGEWLDALLEDWRGFDIDAFQLRLDALRQQRVEVAGQALHVVHVEGVGPNPLPLLLTHGWPGSFLEYLPVLPLLSDPGGHGADPIDAFTVIIPSLPGYGFSDPPPPTGMTGAQVARLWHQLMTVGLGYERFVAHGSDLGAGVTAWLARHQPDAVASIHLATPGLAVTPEPRSEHEERFARAVKEWTAEEGGYMHEHATKPATLGAGLSDSPAGLAAWIGEKIVAWSSTRPDGGPAFDRDLLLGTLTLYWATQTISTSLLPYWAHRHLPGAALPPGDASPVPTAITIFGGERVPFPRPPRELAERYYNVTSWAEYPTGGHFPAAAEPELLAGSLRDAFRPLRNRAWNAQKI
jgi:pimeloyl-ACP methyl ester carboxylesterase